MGTMADLLGRLLGEDVPVRVEFFDGSSIGAPDSPATVRFTSPDALRRILYAPGELGVARAYVAGDLVIEGDILAAIQLRERMPVPKLGPRERFEIARLVSRHGLRRLPPPPEEIRLRGRFHSTPRDQEAVSHHYDVSNEFYELLLGESMSYSCAVWSEPGSDLTTAQLRKHELVCRKLDLSPGDRVLDAGCGWGTMAIHAAREHGATIVGVTLSEQQAGYARKAVADAGLTDRIQIRVQDYRDVNDGPFDAAYSIGMLEHVGSDLPAYPASIFRVLRPGARFAHHAISRPPFKRRLVTRPTFIDRYVFPDADLHEIGHVISAFQEAGFEARHSETLRDHYVLTLRAWLDRLERQWASAVDLIGLGRARIWRLYIAAAVLGFEDNRLQIHQVLSVKPDHGASGMSLVPGDWSHRQRHSRPIRSAHQGRSAIQ